MPQKNFAWSLDERKFLIESEVKKLRNILRVGKDKAKNSGRKTPVKDWFIVEVAVNTGLRVGEISLLQCGDFRVHGKRHYLIVRKGKGGKSRIVRFSSNFQKEFDEFIEWKRNANESKEETAPLFVSSKTGSKMTTRAMQKAFKRSLRKAGIDERKYSIHCLRHTYASFPYKGSGYNLRLVQEQLGHSSIRTTEVYARALDTDIDKAVEKLFKNQ